MDHPNFNSFLKTKKIDPTAFAKAEMELFMEWKNLYDQVHPNSFTQQKLFLINKVRRQFPLPEEAEKVVKKKPMAKPKIVKPKSK